MVIQRTIIHLYTILALIQVFATSQLLIANNIYKIGVNYVDRGGGGPQLYTHAYILCPKEQAVRFQLHDSLWIHCLNRQRPQYH